MENSIRRLGVGMGFALLALIALYPFSHADEAEVTGQSTFIGVTVQKLSDNILERLQYRSGLMVTGVTRGGPADQAGIVKGDVLVVIGSVTLREPDDLVRAEERIQPGQPVDVVISREGGRLIRMLKMEPPAPAIKSVPETRMAETEAMESGQPTANVVEAVAPQPAPPSTADVPKGLAKLGVRAEELNPDLAAAVGLPRGRGLLVLHVEERSPAALAGIRPGDVITGVGQQKVWGAEHLESTLAGAGSVNVSLRRQGAERRVDVQLETAPDPPTMEASEEPSQALPATVQADAEEASVSQLREEVRQLRRELRRLRDEIEQLKADSQRVY